MSEDDYSPVGKQISQRLSDCERRLLPPDKSEEWVSFMAADDETLYVTDHDGLHPKFQYRIDQWKKGGPIEGQPPYEGQGIITMGFVGISPDHRARQGGTPLTAKELADYNASMATFAEYSQK